MGPQACASCSRHNRLHWWPDASILLRHIISFLYWKVRFPAHLERTFTAYGTRFVEGIGLGAGTMLAPTYVAENSPRAIRGFLVGFFQLLLVMGGMMAYFINYGALLHLPVSPFQI